MDVSRPHAAIAPSLDGDVLRVLAGTTRGLTGREVTRLTGRSSHSGVLSVLNRLAEHGLVIRVELNRASLFTLNRRHIAAPIAEAMAELRRRLIAEMRIAVSRWQIEPTHASLFGSTARGDGDTESDIDLLIVRPNSVDEEHPSWRAQLSEMETELLHLTGNQPRIVELSEEELTALRDRQLPLLDELDTDAIHLGGAQLSVLLQSA